MRNCLKTVAQISSICTAESQCTPFGDAHCHPTSPRRCVCRDYAIEDPAQQLCVKRVGLKQYCTKNDDCLNVPNTECNTANNTCYCRTNYYEESETCKPGINAECTTNTDCGVANTECTDGEAKAQPAATAAAINTIAEAVEEADEETNEKTGLLREIDAPRRKRLEKQVSTVVAPTSTSSASSSPTLKSILSPARDEAIKSCKCRSGFVAKNNECLPVAEKYGDECEDTEQCTPLLGDLAECDPEQGVCECKDGAHFNYNKCNKKVVLGETCKRLSECFVEENVEEVQCRNAKCQCGFESVTDAEKTKCVTVATKSE